MRSKSLQLDPVKPLLLPDAGLTGQPRTESPAHPLVLPGPVASNFLEQITAYLQQGLNSELQMRPAGCQSYPQLGPETAYLHQSEDLLAGPLAALAWLPEPEFHSLMNLVKLWQGLQAAWQACYGLRQVLAQIHWEQTQARSPARLTALSTLPPLLATRQQMEQCYSQCDQLANLLDALEHQGLPDTALKALENEYIDILIELGHLQMALDQDWLSVA